MEITVYQNKRNPHKYIEIKHTNCRHYMWRQFMEWDNGVKNYSLKAFRRVCESTRKGVLEDYVKIS